MALVVDSVSPQKFREGDVVTVEGSGFSPVFGENRLLIGGVVHPLDTESATQLVATVKPGLAQDDWVELSVQRTDTLEFSETEMLWSMANLADLRTLSVPGQIPGPRECYDLTASVADTPEAKDYEKLATHAEYQRDEVLQTKGDLMTSSGSALARLPAGGGGSVLHADSGETLGLRWQHPARSLTLSWGKQIDAGATNDPEMVAGGDSSQATQLASEHGVPFDGQIVLAWVLVQVANGADTLDRVRIDVNSANVYNSAAGLGLMQGQTHTAVVALSVRRGDLVELFANKLGVAGVMRLIGSVRLTELRVDVADQVEITDQVTVEKTGLHERSSSDVILVTDEATVEIS